MSRSDIGTFTYLGQFPAITRARVPAVRDSVVTRVGESSICSTRANSRYEFTLVSRAPSNAQDEHASQTLRAPADAQSSAVFPQWARGCRAFLGDFLTRVTSRQPRVRPIPGASARVSSSARLKAVRRGVPAGSFSEVVL